MFPEIDYRIQDINVLNVNVNVVNVFRNQLQSVVRKYCKCALMQQIRQHLMRTQDKCKMIKAYNV